MPLLEYRNNPEFDTIAYRRWERRRLACFNSTSEAGFI